MKEIEFVTQGVCCRKILVEVDENKDVIESCRFVGGCNGNTQGVAALVKGRPLNEVISTLENIKCMSGGRGVTSCPAQLAEALKRYKKEN